MRPIERIAGIVTLDCKRQALLTPLCRRPQVFGDEAELGCLNHFPDLFCVRSRYPPSSLGILDVGAAIPFKSPHVETVVQDASASIDLPSDRRIAPLSSVWARNAFGVECF